MGPFCGEPARTCDAGAAVSDQRGVSEREAACGSPQRRRGARANLRRVGHRGLAPGRRRGPCRLHQGNPGTLPRNRAIIEMNPVYHRRFSFVQIGAPSRTAIPRYQQFLEEVASEAERINARFQSGKWRPIVFLGHHHSHLEIERFYRAASVCMVSSLHDGMNLVAKEFVAAREDEHGVLILSTFAGAALELTDALLVNPYDVQQVAAAILRALEMSDEEQGARIRRMRTTVKDHNVFRWAANLLSDLTDIRIDAPERQENAVAAGDEPEEVRP